MMLRLVFLTMICSAGLTNYARAAGPASSPAETAHPGVSANPGKPPVSPDKPTEVYPSCNSPRVVHCAQPGAVVLLDEVGVRELLAGVELENGDIAAERDMWKERAKISDERATIEQSHAQKSDRQAVWLPIITGLGGAAVTLGVVLGVLKAVGWPQPQHTGGR